MPKRIYLDITGIPTIPVSVSISEGHSAPFAVANIECESTSLSIGDAIAIDGGYTDNHKRLFFGYVKQIDQNIPQNTYTIIAQDILVRASDFFIVSSTPDNPFTRRNILVENLVEDLLDLAGLEIYDYTPTYFTMGINTDIEINLISVQDICKQLADIVTWSFWADEYARIYFKNRKPFVMLSGVAQPGYDEDVPINEGNPYTDDDILDFTHKISEKDLRNKVVVYGARNIQAEASSDTSYNPVDGTYVQVLPIGFYKSAVAAVPYMDRQSEADDSAAYNLELLNRLTESASMTIEGDPDVHARDVIEVQEDLLGISKSWYVFSCEHSFTTRGYTCSMELRR